MIRVLQIVTQMNRAGLENRLMDIYENINRNEIQFDFYTCRQEKGFYDERIIELGGKIYYNEPLKLSTITGIPGRFRRFLQEHTEYRIVHCHLNQWCGVILHGAMQAGAPVRIAHSRTSIEGWTPKCLVKNIIKSPVNKYATHRLAVSRKAAKWLFGARLLRQNQVIIFSNAIDTEIFSYNGDTRNVVREKLGIAEELALIHVGNIRPEKNHFFLIKVFQTLLNTEPNAKLIIVGEDYINGSVQQYAKTLGVYDKIIFMGSRHDIPDLLCASDVFVFPSFYEGFPGSVLEAQAAGLPCIISDTITNEVCLLPSTTRLSLSDPVKKWVKVVLSSKPIVPREKAASYIAMQGYDIKSLCEQMSLLYRKVDSDDT